MSTHTQTLTLTPVFTFGSSFWLLLFRAPARKTFTLIKAAKCECWMGEGRGERKVVGKSHAHAAYE